MYIGKTSWVTMVEYLPFVQIFTSQKYPYLTIILRTINVKQLN